ncbi:MAG TPA: hypothetical protein VF501_00220 [Thiobacillus sp.]
MASQIRGGGMQRGGGTAVLEKYQILQWLGGVKVSALAGLWLNKNLF